MNELPIVLETALVRMDRVTREATQLALQGVNCKAQVVSTAQYNVYSLAVCGLSNAQIASMLSRSDKTVKAHITALLEKVNLRTRTELIVAHHLNVIIVLPEIKRDGPLQHSARSLGTLTGPPACIKCGRTEDHHSPKWFCDGFQAGRSLG